MKLYSAILEKFIDLPVKDSHELRVLLDDLGLEVKDIEETARGPVFTIETLANRGDHLCALGVARELSARLLVQLKHPPTSDLPDRKSSVIVRKETEQCLRYALLEMTVQPRMELRGDIATLVGGAGDQKRHAIVDILNYVALECGQPMHAFDKDTVEGDITVNLTTQSETIEALDGRSYVVPPNALVIRDRRKIIAVAGVIGCANTMVTSGTSRVLIESASFDPVFVRKTARAMGISTDASYTFERGSDVEQVLPALRRVIHLCEGMGAESAQAVGVSVVEGAPTEKRLITVHLPRLRAQLNLPRLPEVAISARLKNLGFSVTSHEGGKDLVVGVPSWRLWDVHNEEDITEECARAQGLSSVKIELPPLDPEIPLQNDMERVLSMIESSLTGSGFYEVITRSFYAQDDVRTLLQLDPSLEGKLVALKNSLESNYAFLKCTNALHFARVAAHNFRMGVESVKIFEFGRLFGREPKPSEEESFEKDVLSIGAAGRWFDGEWQKPTSTKELLLYTKGVVASILTSLGREMHVSESTLPLLHPGLQCSVVSNREIVGFFGVLHPSLAAYCELKGDLVYGELNAKTLARVIERKPYQPPSDFPAIRRDITLAVPIHYFSEKVKRHVLSETPNHLVDVRLVDDFKKEEETFRRVTYRLTFHSSERTLAHDEVDGEMTKIIEMLESKHTLRLA